MSTTEPRSGKHRRFEGRIHPNFDRLESRLALSGIGAGLPPELSPGTSLPGVQGAILSGTDSPIASADPASTSVVQKSPATLSITFKDPIDPQSLGVADFALVHLAADGSATPLSPTEASLSEGVDPADPSGSRIVLSLSRPLGDGHYRLILLADNQLQATDGSFVADSGNDLAVSAFSVETPRRGLAQAVDLGVATPHVSTSSDTLSLATTPGEFKLYKLTLAAGHPWRLGLSVEAQPSENPLHPVLSLFDAKGHLIATKSLGRADSPSDPYLFAGVAPGTYFVGISGEGDVPGQPGGYDPALGVTGTSGLAQSGGRFQLRFVADPVVHPTGVLGLQLDRADPDSTVPTGLTVQFSGSISVDGLAAAGKAALTVVDGSGRSWAVKVAHYDEAQAKLSVLFDQALPPGLYSLEAPASGALVDLSGMVPVASGRPAGVLGTFEVSEGTTSADDLGAIRPGAGKDGASAPIELDAGESIVEHFTVLEPGIYSIAGSDGSTALSLALTRADGSAVAVTPSQGKPGTTQGFLDPGSYSLSLANPGTRSFAGSIRVVEVQSLLDSLLVGGVAQGSALNLRLIDPTLSLDQGVPAPIGSIPPLANNSPSGVYPQAAPGLSSGLVSLASSPQAPARETAATSDVTSGSIVLFTTGPVGRPSPAGGQISVVGPSGPSGSVALASSGEGLPAGLVGIPTPLARGRRVSLPRGPEDQPTGIPTGSATPVIDFGLISRDPQRGADDEALLAASWIDRIAAMSFERLEFLTRRTTPAAWLEGQEAGVPGEILEEGVATALESSTVEVASIAPSVGFGVLAMIAFRNRDRILGKSVPAVNTDPRSRPRPLLSGPHRRNRVLR